MALEIEVFIISVITLIGTIIWNTINTILNIRNYKKAKILSYYPTKKRLFKELYGFIKDLTERMVFTETKQENNYTTYFFKVKKRDGKGYIDPEEQNILQNRIIHYFDELNDVCENKYKTVSNTPKEKLDTLFKIDVQVCYDSITIPNDMIPDDLEKVKELLLKRTVKRAEENSVKLR